MWFGTFYALGLRDPPLRIHSIAHAQERPLESIEAVRKAEASTYFK